MTTQTIQMTIHTNEGITTMSIHPVLMQALVEAHRQDLYRNSNRASLDRAAVYRRSRFRRKR
jgi:hypothetical protein